MPVPFGSVIGQAAGGLLGGQRAGLEMQGQQQKLTQGNAALGQLLDQMRMAAKYYGTEAPTMSDLKSGKFEGLLNKGFPTPIQQPAAPQPQPQSLMSQQPAATPGVQPAVASGGPPDALLSAIHQNESGGRIEGVPDSKAGAVGPMQVLPSTGAQYGVSPDQLRNPEINLSVGKQYATDMWQRYNGDPEATAVAYNAGPKRADMWLASGKVDKLLPQETQQYLAKVRQQLGTGGAQYAQNAVNPATMTDAGSGGMPPPGPVAGGADPSAIRAALAAQQYMFPGAKPTDALNALVAAGMMPQGSFPQQLLTNEALNKSGVKPFLGGERSGVPIRQYNAATGQYDIVGQNPRLGQGQIYNGQGISNVPGAIPSDVARTSAIDWAKVPPAMFQKGVQMQPGGGVAPVPGYPQAQGAVAGAVAGAEAPAKIAVEQNRPIVSGPESSVVIPGQMGAPALPGAPSPTGAPASLVPGGAQAPGVVKQGLSPYQSTAQTKRATEEEEVRAGTIADAKSAQGQQATLQNAMDQVPSFTTGPFAEHVQEAGRYLRLIDPKWDGQVASYEDFVKNSGALLRQAVHDVSSRAAVQEYNLIGKTLPGPDMSPQGLQRVFGQLMGLNDYKIAKAQAQQTWEAARGGSVGGFETDWQKQVTPYAFMISRMAPQDLQEMKAKLETTQEGRAQLSKIVDQLRYVKSTGLDQALQ